MEFRIILSTSLWIWVFLVLKIAESVNSPTPSAYQQSDVPSLSQKYEEVLFTETFNLDNWTDYEKFIKCLRDKEELSNATSHHRPVLYPEVSEVTPNNFFDVILIVSTSSNVTLRIRQENLYLVGYKNATNQWLEFNDFSPTHLIDGSTFLGYNGSYISLENKAGKDRKKIALGGEQLKAAVSNLATSTDTRRRAKLLIVVIQMISESMRFESISTFLSNISNASGNPPPTWVLAQQNSWRKISEELLHVDLDRTHKFHPPSNETRITSEEEAVEAIGMIKYFNFSRISGCNMEANNEGEYPQAYPMVEVP